MKRQEGAVEMRAKVVPEEPVDLAEFRPVVEEVFERLKRSIREHGDWSGYDAGKVFEVVSEEFDEYREAFVEEQVEGRHGQIDELFDVAVTAIKGIRRLSR